MRQARSEPDALPVDEMVGYVLKQAATALRTAMDGAFRPLELTVPQYACLEVLGQRPGLSNAELARAVFVTRQSMNLVLRGLQVRALVTRPTTAPHGRALPTELTTAGCSVISRPASPPLDPRTRPSTPDVSAPRPWSPPR